MRSGATFIISTLLAALLAGCTLPFAGRPAPTPIAAASTPTWTAAPASPTPSSTASASPTPRPSATPTTTPSPTITPTPSPTPPPGERYAAGLRHQRNGQYALAREAYQSVLDDPARADLHGDALYRLGETLGQAGDFVSAEVTLNAFLARFPDHPQRDHALFLLGAAQEKQGKLEAAAASLEQYVVRRPELLSYIQKRLGDLYQAQNKDTLAVAAYRMAERGALWASQRAQYLEALAVALTVQGNFAGAIAEYDRILSIARIGDYRARIQYQAGMTYLAAGQQDAAIERFRRAMAENERSSFAHTALVQLVELNVDVDEFQRGMVNYYNGSYWPAIAAFGRYLAGRAPARADAAQYYLAASYASLNMPAEASAQYKKVLDLYPNSELFGEAWLARARQIGRAGDIEGARAAYQEFAQRFPSHSLAARALWTRARLAEDAGRLAEAAAEYRDLAEAYPQYQLGTDGLRRAGLLLYRLGQLAAAAGVWDKLAGQAPSAEARYEALFWAGKARLALGEISLAQAALRAVAAAQPLHYYGQRAAALLGAPAAPSSLAGETQAEAEAWLMEWAGLSAETLHQTAPAEIAGNSKWVRGCELAAIGLRAEADEEFGILRAEYADRPAHLFYLAVEFERLGEPRHAIGCAQRLLQLAGGKWDAAPSFVRRLAYPANYYNDLIEAEAQARGVDPLLVYALVRQESLFQGQAISSAAAHGLMQVMPETGKWIAMRLGWPNFAVVDLHLPYINVKFGVYYLQQQLATFDQDVVSALIAYNAGPGNAAAWRKKAGSNDPDLLYAQAEIEETRIYLQTVSYNYAAYRQLYSSARAPF